jgi:anti-sigma B factor antagonist
MSAGEQLTTKISVDGEDGCIVWLSGELDMATHDRAATALELALRQAGGGRLTVDLSELAFIDASGVRALVRLHNAAVEARVRLRLRGGHGLVAQVLDLCGLTDVTETIASTSEKAAGWSSRSRCPTGCGMPAAACGSGSPCTAPTCM